MVHVIDMGMPLPELLAQHAARRRRHALLPRQRRRPAGRATGRVWPEAFAARERGILFDVGHGVGSFTWRVARAALAQGFPPDTISSDIHTYNHAGPVHDLPRTLSKLLHLGMPLADVIAAATSRVGAHLAHVAPGRARDTGARGSRRSQPARAAARAASRSPTASTGSRRASPSTPASGWSRAASCAPGAVIACDEPA